MPFAVDIANRHIDSKSASPVKVVGNVVYISDAVLGRLLSSDSSITRLAGLSLLVTSTYSTRPFTRGALDCLKEGLPHLLADTDSYFRGEVQSFVKAVLDRLRASTFLIARKSSQDTQGNTNDMNMDYHKQFVVWLHEFLIAELHPTASYQRHISAVVGLHILLRSGIDPTVPAEILSRLAKNSSQWPFHLKIINDLARRLLFDLLLDPFDDVRQGALNILKIDKPILQVPNAASQRANVAHENSILSHGVDASANAYEDVVLDRAKTIMLRTGRVDHADGVARLFDLRSYGCSQRQYTAQQSGPHSVDSRLTIVTDLMTLLEKSLEAARVNISHAVSSFPLHGIFTALR